MIKLFKKWISLSITIFVSMLINTSVHADTAIEQFFKAPLISTMILRPDGKAVLSIKDENGIQYLSIKSLPNGNEKTLFTPSEYGAVKSMIGPASWLDNRYFALQFLEPKTGIADLINTKISRRLLIIDSLASPGTPEQVLSVKTSGWLIDSLPGTDGQFLYAKSGMQSGIYKLNAHLLKPDKTPLSKSDKIDGGQFIADNQTNQVDGYATRWFSEKSGQIKAALHFTAPYTLTLTEFKPDGKQDPVFSWKLLESNEKQKNNNEQKDLIENYLPLALGKNDSEYYCLDQKEEESKSLYLVNFKTKTHKLIYETAAFKIVDLAFSPDGQLNGVQVLKNERLVLEPLSNNTQPTETTNQKKLALTLNTSTDLQHKLIYEESHNQPGQFWLETQNPRSRLLIGEKYPWLSNKLLSTQIEGELEVEGLKIPYLLNLPKSTTKIPLIVMPHGGPIGVFDSPYFDNLTQFFNAQGFAVLRVNFRGSSGRSQQLREAGRKEWGNRMLKDIHQATLSVLAHNNLDQTRVCLFGTSYGAYAATMLLITQPETYQCAVAASGVYDLNLYLQSAQLSDKQDQWLKENVGNFQTEYEDMKLISPVFLAAKLQKPLLLLHGDADNVVDIEQSMRMKFSLDKAKKNANLITLEGLGHGFSSSADAEKLLSPSIAFLRENLASPH